MKSKRETVLRRKMEAIPSVIDVIDERPTELPISADKTSRLTKAEVKLLLGMADPNNRDKTVTDLVNIVGVHRDTYYRSFQKPHFVEAYNYLALSLVRQAAMPLVHSGVKFALQGSFHHWKVLMEMGGLYDPKRMTIEEGDSGEITVRFADNRRRVDVTPDQSLNPSSE